MDNEESRDVVERSGYESQQDEDSFEVSGEPAHYLTRLLVSAHRLRFRESRSSPDSSSQRDPDSEPDGSA